MHSTPRPASGALLAALLLASCSSDPTQASPTFLEGDWHSCFTDEIAPYGTLDVRATLSFSGDRYQYDAVGYGSTTNGTCGGTGFAVDSSWGTFTVGGAVQATLGASTVTARAIDLLEYQGQGQSTPRHTIAHLDAAADPDILYVNLTGLATTPQTRPTTLDDGRPFRPGP